MAFTTVTVFLLFTPDFADGDALAPESSMARRNGQMRMGTHFGGSSHHVVAW